MDSNHQDEDDFGADEAIPLVIFNEEKKSKLNFRKLKSDFSF
jgi:hypothetical protein